jgi:hypothetical protein
VENVGSPDYLERYLKPLGRRMNIFEGKRVVIARVEGNSFVGPGNSQAHRLLMTLKSSIDNES